MVLQSIEDDAMVEPSALQPRDIHALFATQMDAAGIQPHHRIAIAVSGGPDSMALYVLVQRWWQGFRESGIKAERPMGIVVDHGLRPESAAEALQVQSWVTNLGMECEVLKCEWIEGRPDSGHLQEAARNARYSLMEETCWKNGVVALVTGHHADDQAELFMMRLARSSGIIGLAGMASVSHLYSRRPTSTSRTGVLLVRPLLQFRKQDLYAVCRDGGQDWVEDPSNSNPTFARNRIRQVLSDPLYDDARRQIHQLIAACRQTRAVVDKRRDELLAKTVTLSKDFAYVGIDVNLLASSNASDAVLGRLLVAVLQFVAQREKPPRGKALKILMDKIREPPIKEAFTLGGCHVSPAPGSKGTKLMVCLSPESPTPALSSDMISWESSPSVKPRDSPLVPTSNITTKQQAILDASNGAPNVIDQGRKLGLVSEEVAILLRSLKQEIAETMSKTIEELKSSSEPIPIPDGLDIDSRNRQMLPLGHTCYFMNRFLVSWKPRVIIAPENNKKQEVGCMTLSGNERGRCCLLRDKPSAWVRHYEERDYEELTRVLKTNFKTRNEDKVQGWCVYRYESDLFGSNEEKRRQMQLELAKSSSYKKDTSKKPKLARSNTTQSSQKAAVEVIHCGGFVTSKAQRVLALLKCIPKPVRRGLPVLVNAQGLLLAIPTLGFQRCPWVSASAVVHPRVPLGGGHASWT